MARFLMAADPEQKLCQVSHSAPLQLKNCMAMECAKLHTLSYGIISKDTAADYYKLLLACGNIIPLYQTC